MNQQNTVSKATISHTAKMPGQNTILGHPKGLFLVSGVELWERFSYYGMLGLLVLFLTASTSTGGFGWSTETALKLMGAYTGLVFAAPAIGGLISNRYWGERRCIFVGGLLVAGGHLLLGGPVYFPLLIDTIGSSNTAAILHADGLSFEALFIDAATLQPMLADAGENIEVTRSLLLAYHLKVWSFLIGLALIVLGTGLIKPTVSSIINTLYAPEDKNRQNGFTIFMVSIYIGSFSANFIAGTLGEKIGWHVGFTAAAIGMVIGVTAYLVGQQRYLGDIGVQPQNARTSAQESRPPLSKEHKQRIGLILLMGAFTVLYAVAFYQKGGLLNLYTSKLVDRTAFGFEIPTTWFLTISTGTFIIFAASINRLWQRWFPAADALQKLSLGLLLIACGYVVMGTADYARDADVGTSAIWMALTYVFFGLGDIFVWPAQIAAAAALAP